MKRIALLLLLTGTALWTAAPARAANVTLLGFTGFDYVEPSPGPPGPGFLKNGDVYDEIGFVTSFDALLAGYVNPTTNEYTFWLNSANVITSTFTNNTLEVQFAPNARFSVFEDPKCCGTPATYGTLPPNATAPGTFSDGTLILGASINNLVLTYSYDTFQGNFFGTATLDAGSDLVAIPPARRSGWLLGGQAGPPNATVPAGYVNQVSGELQIPDATPAQHKSWGAIKALYR